MRISKEAVILGAIGVGVIAFVGFLIWQNPQTNSSAGVDQSLLLTNAKHLTGQKNAKVVLVEFGDYQCPACGLVHPILKEVTDMYKDKDFTFVFRNFPLPQHQNAIIAAEAAEAAGAQGKYWEMHDKLFEKQNEWSESADPLTIFLGYARELNLDVNQFQKDVLGNAYTSIIQTDQQDGNKLFLNHTPTVYLNGEEIEDVSLQNLKSRIDAVLAK